MSIEKITDMVPEIRQWFDKLPFKGRVGIAISLSLAGVGFKLFGGDGWLKASRILATDYEINLPVWIWVLGLTCLGYLLFVLGFPSLKKNQFKRKFILLWKEYLENLDMISLYWSCKDGETFDSSERDDYSKKCMDRVVKGHLLRAKLRHLLQKLEKTGFKSEYLNAKWTNTLDTLPFHDRTYPTVFHFMLDYTNPIPLVITQRELYGASEYQSRLYIEYIENELSSPFERFKELEQDHFQWTENVKASRLAVDEESAEFISKSAEA